MIVHTFFYNLELNLVLSVEQLNLVLPVEQAEALAIQPHILEAFGDSAGVEIT